jgi:group I intron endonuclease
MGAGIYRITNAAAGKVYVGSSANVRGRFGAHRHLLRHRRHHNIHLQRAWDLDGEASFRFELLELVVDASLLLVREQHWIDALGAADQASGYNFCPVAGTRAGSKQPPDFGPRQSALMSGKAKSAEHKARIGAANKGRRRTAEQRARYSEATRRYFAEHPEARASRVAQMTGKPAHNRGQRGGHFSAETRRRMSAAARRRHGSLPLPSMRINLLRSVA